MMGLEFGTISTASILTYILTIACALSASAKHAAVRGVVVDNFAVEMNSNDYDNRNSNKRLHRVQQF